MKIPAVEIKEVGKVEEVRQGITRIEGLPSCSYGELIEFSPGLEGMVIEFGPGGVLAMVFGDERQIKVGDVVVSKSEVLKIPVGEKFLGRIVDGLAQPLDGKGKIKEEGFLPVFRKAHGVMEREPIYQPLLTGVKILDLIVPIGKGQRELIVGDRQTGKSSLALDTILNQKGKDVICIYCWIGGNQIAFSKIMNFLAQEDALSYTIGVCASGGSSSALQYICPYTAATLGEYFMEKGRDVLVVFDDLTKHAWIHRQISLLLERAPGREAYPGDVFFLHSQLMERAGKLRAELGGGSMTFLPIVETLQGDITGYIQSNLVSMTDGQIYLNASLFHEGFRPAIDLGLSVSRIGSKVQPPGIREVSSGLRFEYSRWRELLRLTRLKTRLSEEAELQLRRGEILTQLLIQENRRPVSLSEEILLFYVFSQQILEKLSEEGFKQFKREFFNYVKQYYPEVVDILEKTGELTPQIKETLNKVLQEFFKLVK